MSFQTYDLTTAAWTDCGASDDCTIQIPQSVAPVLFTVGASDPGAGVVGGIRLGNAPGDARFATIQKAGQKVWARSTNGPVTVTVER